MPKAFSGVPLPDHFNPTPLDRWLLVAREMGVPGDEGEADRMDLDEPPLRPEVRAGAAGAGGRASTEWVAGGGPMAQGAGAVCAVGGVRRSPYVHAAGNAERSRT